MDNFLIGFNAVIPMMLYMAFGQFFTRSGMIKQEAYSQFNKAIFSILLPLNLFSNVYNTNLDTEFNALTLNYSIIFAVLAFVILAIIIPFFEKDNTKRGVVLQGSIRSNAILFGLPLGIALLGEENLGMVTIVLAIIVPVNNIFSVIAFSLYSDEFFSVKKVLIDVIKNPMVIFTLAGIVVASLNIKLPLVLESTMSNLVRMTTPLALIVMGGSFNFGKLKDASKSLYGTVALRLVIIPTIALFISGYILGFRGDDIIAVLIATAGPTAVSSYAQAVVAGGDADLANQIVVFTTLCSMFTLVIFISILKNLAYF
ncbi:AEC family transporter [Aerococcaceae bacterium WGS1372]